MPLAFWHIRNCSLFEHLDSSQWSLLETDARTRKFERGSAVYLPSDPSSYLFFLQQGRIRLSTTTPEGKLAILSFIEPGEVFGELSLIDEGQREERADAMVSSVVVLLNRDVVGRLMEQTASLSLSVTKLIGLRRRRVERRLRSLLFRSNRERLAVLLIDLLKQYPVADCLGTKIGIRLSHQELGSLIGATRESVTLILGQWQTDGVVQISRQQIVVRDKDRLLDELHR